MKEKLAAVRDLPLWWEEITARDYWMYLVVRVLRSKTEVEHEGRECGWAYCFDGLVREASLTVRVEAAKQRTQHKIRDGLGWRLGRAGNTTDYIGPICQEKDLCYYFFPQVIEEVLENLIQDHWFWPMRTDQIV